jgi:hypothetical protein
MTLDAWFSYSIQYVVHIYPVIDSIRIRHVYITLGATALPCHC